MWSWIGSFHFSSVEFRDFAVDFDLQYALSIKRSPLTLGRFADPKDVGIVARSTRALDVVEVECVEDQVALITIFLGKSDRDQS